MSVVVVAHDMSREIIRTAQSLSPAAQQGITASEYELLVVDNGSTEPIDREACEAYGATIRWLRIDNAPISPAMAANRGLMVASAPLVGVMIDGARMASPGLLHHALAAARLSPRPVIGTFSFHLGRELQQHAVPNGYDASTEDALLSTVDWENDGYALFDISVPAASSAGGWFDLPVESNALFLPNHLWEELAGYEERFEAPGGGFVNLDTFRRACELPDSTLIMLLGEGTFHQVHGGVSTNNREPEEARRRYEAFHEEYVRIRGRPFGKSDRRPLLVGTPSRQAVSAILTPAGVARRYINLLKQALLNETSLEAEAAYFLARDAVERGEPFDDSIAFDVRGKAPEYFRRLRYARNVGRYFERKEHQIGFGYTMIGRQRLDHLDWCVSTVLAESIPGDLVECGVWRGGAAILMRGVLAAWQVDDRRVWLADSFLGVSKPESPHDTIDLSAEERPELVISQERVSANFARFDLLDEQVRFLAGWFRDTLPDAPIESIALLRLDGDMYDSTMTSLTALYDRVSPGGFVVIDDYAGLEFCRRAVEDFRSARGITEPIEMIDWTGAYWRKRQVVTRHGGGGSSPDRGWWRRVGRSKSSGRLG
jgi:hypothetical protein